MSSLVDIQRQTLKVLCMVAVSKKDLSHWHNPVGEEWEKHVKVMISRFRTNTNAGLILATAAVLLSSNPPLSRFLAYDNPAAYISAAVAFCAALLNVIFGATVLIMYESCTSHNDMSRLTEMTHWQKNRMLVWLAGPPIYMIISTTSMLLSILFACCLSEYTTVKTIAGFVTFAFLCSFTLTLSLIVDDHWSNTQPNVRDGRMG